MKKKTDQELFEELYNEMSNELGVKDISEFDADGFIEYCETFYKMTTEQFKKNFEENDFEGNVDHQIWYQIIKNKE